MAKGVINLQKESGGIVKISPVDGIGVTEVTVPESGNLVSVGTAVTDNAIARYDGTTGKLQDSRVFVDDSGNIGVGVIPTNWGSENKAFQIGATSAFWSYQNSGTQLSNNYLINPTYGNQYLTNGYATTYVQNNSGQHAWYNAPSGTAGNSIPFVQAMILDTSGNLLLSSGTGALGYGAGAGGIVTQLTSKETNVTLNKPSGRIITHNSLLLANTIVGFSLYNSLVTDKDTVIISLNSGAYAPYLFNIWGYVSNGIISIYIKNISTSDVSQHITISFAIIKGAIV